MSKRRRSNEHGTAALSTVAALGVLLLFVVVLLQFSVWLYAKGSVRAAAMEAAREAAPLGAAPGACERRFESVRSSLLAGRLGEQVGEPTCLLGPDMVTVTVDAQLERWLPLSPDWNFTVTATAVREAVPE